MRKERERQGTEDGRERDGSGTFLSSGLFAFKWNFIKQIHVKNFSLNFLGQKYQEIVESTVILR